MPEEPKKQRKENPTQRDAFLSYFNLGENRSLEKLREEYSKGSPKRDVSIHTLKSWCTKYKWLERCQAMDEEVTQKAEQIAIKEATAKKSDILKAVKNTMIRYNQAVLSGQIVPSASDFKKMWEVARIELGKSIGQEALAMPAPSINIFLTKNERIIKVVHQAQEDLRKALAEEIKEDEENN
jgi:hypothetical protein